MFILNGEGVYHISCMYIITPIVNFNIFEALIVTFGKKENKVTDVHTVRKSSTDILTGILSTTINYYMSEY